MILIAPKTVDLEISGAAKPVSEIKAFTFGVTEILFSPNRALLFLFDIVVLTIGFVICTWLSPFGTWGEWGKQLTVGCISFSLSFTAIALGLGYYERARRYSYYKVITTGFLACLLSLPIGLSAVYFTYYGVFGRLTFAWGAFGAYFGVTIFRLALAKIYSFIPYRFTIIGTSSGLEELKRFFRNTANRESRCYIHSEVASFTRSDGSISLQAMLQARVGEIVFAQTALSDSNLLDLAVAAVKSNFRLLDEIDFFAGIFERIPLDVVSSSWLLNRGLNARNTGEQLLKRILDVLISAVGLVLLSPILLAIGITIKCTSPGGVLFIQPRQGRFNKPFRMYKFRTMRDEVSCKNASGGFTKSGDPRLTKIGRLLRPLHLDELPQLINVLRGDMSLVGPRPEALEFARKMASAVELYEIRNLVRPGLTGHAQILCGYMMDTIEDTKLKLEYDLFYICNYSTLLDLRVLLRTTFVVIRRVIR